MAVQKKKWEEYSDEDLLKMRICDLGLEISGSWLEGQIERLYKEFESKGIQFKPRCYLGDEWFSPEGVPYLSIPFYLASPRLISLERSMMYEVEGGTADTCIRFLRHEAGHCMDHAYRLSRKPNWKKTFGDPNVEYDPDNFWPRPYSRSFVKNIDNFYAQSHPAEDFAETFAVWLNPESRWEENYKNWKKAYAKLNYVDETVKEVASKPALVKSGPKTSAARRLKSTLGRYYAQRRKINAEDLPDFYDADLRRIFSGDQSLPKKTHGAARFLRQHRKRIINIVSRWCRSRKYTTHRLMKKLINRCEEIDLRRDSSEEDCAMEVAAYLASIVTRYLFTGSFSRTF